MTLAMQLVLSFAFAQTSSFCLINDSSPLGISVTAGSSGSNPPNWSNESKAIDNNSSTPAVASFSRSRGGSGVATLTFNFTSPVVAGSRIRFKVSSTVNEPAALSVTVSTGSGQSFTIPGVQIPNPPGGYLGDTGPSDTDGFLVNANTNSITLTFTVSSGAGAIQIDDIEKNCYDTILPVSLISFTATRDNQVNRLKWSTDSETNNKGFEIQRSADAVKWEMIGFIPSEMVNSSAVIHYSYTDDTPLQGVNYYRLRQVDTDGEFSFSPKRAVQEEPANDITIGANPATDILNIGGDVNSVRTAMIIDYSGRATSHDIMAGNSLDVSKLGKGVYILQLGMMSGQKINKRFVKE